jgi:sec-independent protein translocase protein TatC
VTTEPGAETLSESSLMSHLLELRSRLLRSVVAIGIGCIPCVLYANQLFAFVARPLIKALPKGATLISISLVAPLTTPFKLAMYCGIAIAMPYVLYQIWGFIAPGLYKHEKRFAVPLLVSSVMLFYMGIAVAYFVVFPLMFKFFTATAPEGVQMMTDMTQYLDLVLVLFLAFGVAFEIPVAIVLLVYTGVVKLHSLTTNRGYVLIAVFVQALVISPPDVVSLCITALPIYALYEVGILMARILTRGKLEARAKAQREAENSG